MKKTILLSLLCFTISTFCSDLQSQNIEYGVKGGTSFYFGDLAPASHVFSIGTLGPSGGLYLKRQFNDFFSVRGDFTYMFLHADDANGSESWRATRNLDFATHLFEGTVSMEFVPFEIRLGQRNNIHPYLGVGLGIYNFDPYTIYNGSEVSLQPLNTEGQGLEGYGNPYALTQVNIPMRAGLQLSLSSGLTLGLEFCYRNLFTDYLDDVSGSYVPNTILSESYGPLSALLADKSPNMINSTDTGFGVNNMRGAPETEDGYGDLVLTIGYSISRRKVGSGFTRNKVSCPTF